MLQLTRPYSLLDALLAYEANVRATMLPKKAEAKIAQVRTALWRYTLPGWHFVALMGQRLSQEEYEQGLDFLRQLPFEQLRDAPEAQERLFEQLAVAGNSRRNYRWALNGFMGWCEEQDWLEMERGGKRRRAESRKQKRKQSTKTLSFLAPARVPKFTYRLAESEKSASLKQEFDLFSQFLTGSGADGSESRKVSISTARQYLGEVGRILGWFHPHQKLPLQNLSLRLLVEVKTIPGEQEPQNLQAKADAKRMIALVRAYLEWLRTRKREKLEESSEAIQSPYTEIKVINIWLALVRFVYRQDIASEGKQAEKARAAMTALRDLRRELSAKLKVHQRVSDESKKRLEWHEFLELVETLRGECVSRFHQSTQSKQGGSTLGSSRSLTAIAYSYQRFLLTAFLAYIPPQRSQVLRNLVVTLPLPETTLKAQAFADEESTLYQHQNAWWIKIVKQKTTCQRAPESFLIPNLVYADGRSFYQYLEEWLLHYVYEDVQGRAVALPGLRRCFDPQHLRLFTMKKGQPYQDAAAFIKLLRHPAARIARKALDFHTVQQMYLEYLGNREHSVRGSEQPAGVSAGKAVTSPLAPLTAQKKYEYNSTDWQKAAEIAQAFLLPRS